MHSQIFEINDAPLAKEDWSDENAIANGNGDIDGADYWIPMSKKDRTLSIEGFFKKWFPDNSFEIVKNEVGDTAVVRFTGNIEALYTKWIEQIQKEAGSLSANPDAIDLWGVYNVRYACEHPFGLCSKFYQEFWNGCTVDADDFIGMLRMMSKKHEGKPFELYVGQVFDYHF